MNRGFIAVLVLATTFGATLPASAQAPRKDYIWARSTSATITMDGDSDGVVPATDGKAYASKFTGWRAHRIVNAGHNVPQEAPQAFADAVWELASASR